MAIKTQIKDGKKIYEVYLNGFDSQGKRIQRRARGIESLRKAEIVEFDLKRELALIREQKVNLKWGEWLEKCIERMKATYQPSTVINYEKQMNKSVNPHWKEIELRSFTRDDVHKMIYEKIDDSINMRTKRWVLDMIRRIFQMAVEEGILDKNPASGMRIKVPEVDQKVLTNSEVVILLKEAQICSHRFYPVWAMALMTGMRSGELFALKWTDLDFDAKIISVNKQWTNKVGFCPTKTRKNRIVPISTELSKFLKKYKLEQGQSEFVLPHLPEWINGMQADVLRDFCKVIGVTPVKFHDLRATFITNLLARGESLARVMSMVGHTQLKTTNCYLRKAGVDVQGGTEKLGYGVPDSAEAQVFSIVR